jgi:hypothetical protein
MAMKKDDERKRFQGIVAAIDDAILAATPAEIVEELRALGIDPSASATAMRARIRAAVAVRGKALLKAAAEQARADRRVTTLRRVSDKSEELRAKLARLLSLPGVPATLAARGGQGMTDADVESLIEDLAEVGITGGEPE